MEEIWKDIPGLEGRYIISNLGNVYSLLTRMVMRVQRNKVNGYCYVNLTLGNGSQKNFIVHRLVSSAFFGECPKGYQVNHKNGVRHDNRANNLEYLTKTENERHSWEKLGRKPTIHIGSSHPLSKLDEESVIRARELHFTGGYKFRDLAKIFGVSTTTIHRAVMGITWSHI